MREKNKEGLCRIFALFVIVLFMTTGISPGVVADTHEESTGGQGIVSEEEVSGGDGEIDYSDPSKIEFDNTDVDFSQIKDWKLISAEQLSKLPTNRLVELTQVANGPDLNTLNSDQVNFILSDGGFDLSQTGRFSGTTIAAQGDNLRNILNANPDLRGALNSEQLCGGGSPCNTEVMSNVGDLRGVDQGALSQTMRNEPFSISATFLISPNAENVVFENGELVTTGPDGAVSRMSLEAMQSPNIRSIVITKPTHADDPLSGFKICKKDETVCDEIALSPDLGQSMEYLTDDGGPYLNVIQANGEALKIRVTGKAHISGRTGVTTITLEEDGFASVKHGENTFLIDAESPIVITPDTTNNQLSIKEKNPGEGGMFRIGTTFDSPQLLGGEVHGAELVLTNNPDGTLADVEAIQQTGQDRIDLRVQLKRKADPIMEEVFVNMGSFGKLHLDRDTNGVSGYRFESSEDENINFRVIEVDAETLEEVRVLSEPEGNSHKIVQGYISTERELKAGRGATLSSLSKVEAGFVDAINGLSDPNNPADSFTLVDRFVDDNGLEKTVERTESCGDRGRSECIAYAKQQYNIDAILNEKRRLSNEDAGNAVYMTIFAGKDASGKQLRPQIGDLSAIGSGVVNVYSGNQMKKIEMSEGAALFRRSPDLLDMDSGGGQALYITSIPPADVGADELRDYYAQERELAVEYTNLPASRLVDGKQQELKVDQEGNVYAFEKESGKYFSVDAETGEVVEVTSGLDELIPNLQDPSIREKHVQKNGIIQTRVSAANMQLQNVFKSENFQLAFDFRFSDQSNKKTFTNSIAAFQHGFVEYDDAGFAKDGQLIPNIFELNADTKRLISAGFTKATTDYNAEGSGGATGSLDATSLQKAKETIDRNRRIIGEAVQGLLKDGGELEAGGTRIALEGGQVVIGEEELSDSIVNVRKEAPTGDAAGQTVLEQNIRAALADDEQGVGKARLLDAARSSFLADTSRSDARKQEMRENAVDAYKGFVKGTGDLGYGLSKIKDEYKKAGSHGKTRELIQAILSADPSVAQELGFNINSFGTAQAAAKEGLTVDLKKLQAETFSDEGDFDKQINTLQSIAQDHRVNVDTDLANAYLQRADKSGDEEHKNAFDTFIGEALSRAAEDPKAQANLLTTLAQARGGKGDFTGIYDLLDNEYFMDLDDDSRNGIINAFSEKLVQSGSLDSVKDLLKNPEFADLDATAQSQIKFSAFSRLLESETDPKTRQQLIDAAVAETRKGATAGSEFWERMAQISQTQGDFSKAETYFRKSEEVLGDEAAALSFDSRQGFDVGKFAFKVSEINTQQLYNLQQAGGREQDIADTGKLVLANSFDRSTGKALDNNVRNIVANSFASLSRHEDALIEHATILDNIEGRTENVEGFHDASDAEKEILKSQFVDAHVGASSNVMAAINAKGSLAQSDIDRIQSTIEELKLAQEVTGGDVIAILGAEDTELLKVLVGQVVNTKIGLGDIYEQFERKEEAQGVYTDMLVNDEVDDETKEFLKQKITSIVIQRANDKSGDPAGDIAAKAILNELLENDLGFSQQDINVVREELLNIDLRAASRMIERGDIEGAEALLGKLKQERDALISASQQVAAAFGLIPIPLESLENLDIGSIDSYLGYANQEGQRIDREATIEAVDNEQGAFDLFADALGVEEGFDLDLVFGAADKFTSLDTTDLDTSLKQLGVMISQLEGLRNNPNISPEIKAKLDQKLESLRNKLTENQGKKDESIRKEKDKARLSITYFVEGHGEPISEELLTTMTGAELAEQLEGLEEEDFRIFDRVEELEGKARLSQDERDELNALKEKSDRLMKVQRKVTTAMTDQAFANIKDLIAEGKIDEAKSLYDRASGIIGLNIGAGGRRSDLQEQLDKAYAQAISSIAGKGLTGDMTLADVDGLRAAIGKSLAERSIGLTQSLKDTDDPQLRKRYEDELRRINNQVGAISAGLALIIEKADNSYNYKALTREALIDPDSTGEADYKGSGKSEGVYLRELMAIASAATESGDRRAKIEARNELRQILQDTQSVDVLEQVAVYLTKAERGEDDQGVALQDLMFVKKKLEASGIEGGLPRELAFLNDDKSFKAEGAYQLLGGETGSITSQRIQMRQFLTNLGLDTNLDASSPDGPSEYDEVLEKVQGIIKKQEFTNNVDAQKAIRDGQHKAFKDGESILNAYGGVQSSLDGIAGAFERGEVMSGAGNALHGTWNVAMGTIGAGAGLIGEMGAGVGIGEFNQEATFRKEDAANKIYGTQRLALKKLSEMDDSLASDLMRRIANMNPSFAQKLGDDATEEEKRLHLGYDEIGLGETIHTNSDHNFGFVLGQLQRNHPELAADLTVDDLKALALANKRTNGQIAMDTVLRAASTQEEIIAAQLKFSIAKKLDSDMEQQMRKNLELSGRDYDNPAIVAGFDTTETNLLSNLGQAASGLFTVVTKVRQGIHDASGTDNQADEWNSKKLEEKFGLTILTNMFEEASKRGEKLSFTEISRLANSKDSGDKQRIRDLMPEGFSAADISNVRQALEDNPQILGMRSNELRQQGKIGEADDLHGLSLAHESSIQAQAANYDVAENLAAQAAQFNSGVQEFADGMASTAAYHRAKQPWEDLTVSIGDTIVGAKGMQSVASGASLVFDKIGLTGAISNTRLGNWWQTRQINAQVSQATQIGDDIGKRMLKKSVRNRLGTSGAKNIARDVTRDLQALRVAQATGNREVMKQVSQKLMQTQQSVALQTSVLGTGRFAGIARSMGNTLRPAFDMFNPKELIEESFEESLGEFEVAKTWAPTLTQAIMTGRSHINVGIDSKQYRAKSQQDFKAYVNTNADALRDAQVVYGGQIYDVAVDGSEMVLTQSTAPVTDALSAALADSDLGVRSPPPIITVSNLDQAQDMIVLKQEGDEVKVQPATRDLALLRLSVAEKTSTDVLNQQAKGGSEAERSYVQHQQEVIQADKEIKGAEVDVKIAQFETSLAQRDVASAAIAQRNLEIARRNVDRKHRDLIGQRQRAANQDIVDTERELVKADNDLTASVNDRVKKAEAESKVAALRYVKQQKVKEAAELEAELGALDVQAERQKIKDLSTQLESEVGAVKAKAESDLHNSKITLAEKEAELAELQADALDHEAGLQQNYQRLLQRQKIENNDPDTSAAIESEQAASREEERNLELQAQRLRSDASAAVGKLVAEGTVTQPGLVAAVNSKIELDQEAEKVDADLNRLRDQLLHLPIADRDTVLGAAILEGITSLEQELEGLEMRKDQVAQDIREGFTEFKKQQAGVVVRDVADTQADQILEDFASTDTDSVADSDLQGLVDGLGVDASPDAAREIIEEAEAKAIVAEAFREAGLDQSTLDVDGTSLSFTDSVQEVSGIGPKLAFQLETKLGVKNIGDLAGKSEADLKSISGIGDLKAKELLDAFNAATDVRTEAAAEVSADVEANQDIETDATTDAQTGQDLLAEVDTALESEKADAQTGSDLLAEIDSSGDSDTDLDAVGESVVGVESDISSDLDSESIQEFLEGVDDSSDLSDALLDSVGESVVNVEYDIGLSRAEQVRGLETLVANKEVTKLGDQYFTKDGKHIDLNNPQSIPGEISSRISDAVSQDIVQNAPKAAEVSSESSIASIGLSIEAQTEVDQVREAKVDISSADQVVGGDVSTVSTTTKPSADTSVDVPHSLTDSIQEISGIGPKLAFQLESKLGVKTLADLEGKSEVDLKTIIGLGDVKAKALIDAFSSASGGVDAKSEAANAVRTDLDQDSFTDVVAPLSISSIVDGEVKITNEQGELETLVITSDNAKEILSDIKARDRALIKQGLPTGSYDLRQELVSRSDSKVTTADAYTLDDLADVGDVKAYLGDPGNWMPERRAVQEKMFNEEYVKAQSLSGRLADTEATVYALRGNTAAGKTTALKSNDIFKKAIDSEGEPSGAINPDTFKASLRNSDVDADGAHTMTHYQAHAEGSMLARRLVDQVLADKDKQLKSSMVIDKRLSESSDTADLLKIADETGRDIKILDIDGSLEDSAVRVLQRTAAGDSPLPPFSAVAEGFEGIRENRAGLIEQVINNPKITDYVLYANDESGSPVKVAEKKDGVFSILPGMESEYERVIDPGAASIVDQIANTVITEDYIQAAMAKTPEKYRASVQKALEPYKGQTFKEALDAHSKKVTDADAAGLLPAIDEEIDLEQGVVITPEIESSMGVMRENAFALASELDLQGKISDVQKEIDAAVESGDTLAMQEAQAKKFMYEQMGSILSITPEQARVRQLESHQNTEGEIVPGVKFGQSNSQADGVGGDYVLTEGKGGKARFELADITQHGPDAAYANELFSKLRDIADKITGGDFEASRKVYNSLVAELGDIGLRNSNGQDFQATSIAAELDTETGDLTMFHSGHEMPFRISADGTISKLNPGAEGRGSNIGAVEGQKSVKHQLDSGDRVVVVSDGVLEATGPLKFDKDGNPAVEKESRKIRDVNGEFVLDSDGTSKEVEVKVAKVLQYGSLKKTDLKRIKTYYGVDVKPIKTVLSENAGKSPAEITAAIKAEVAKFQALGETNQEKAGPDVEIARNVDDVSVLVVEYKDVKGDVKAGNDLVGDVSAVTVVESAEADLESSSTELVGATESAGDKNPGTLIAEGCSSCSLLARNVNKLLQDAETFKRNGNGAGAKRKIEEASKLIHQGVQPIVKGILDGSISIKKAMADMSLAEIEALDSASRAMAEYGDFNGKAELNQKLGLLRTKAEAWNKLVNSASDGVKQQVQSNRDYNGEVENARIDVVQQFSGSGTSAAKFRSGLKTANTKAAAEKVLAQVQSIAKQSGGSKLSKAQADQSRVKISEALSGVSAAEAQVILEQVVDFTNNHDVLSALGVPADSQRGAVATVLDLAASNLPRLDVGYTAESLLPSPISVDVDGNPVYDFKVGNVEGRLETKNDGSCCRLTDADGKPLPKKAIEEISSSSEARQQFKKHTERFELSMAEFQTGQLDSEKVKIDEELKHLFDGRKIDDLSTEQIRAELTRRHASILEAESGSEAEFYQEIVDQVYADHKFTVDRMIDQKKLVGDKVTQDRLVQDTEAYKVAVARKLVEFNKRQAVGIETEVRQDARTETAAEVQLKIREGAVQAANVQSEAAKVTKGVDVDAIIEHIQKKVGPLLEGTDIPSGADLKPTIISELKKVQAELYRRGLSTDVVREAALQIQNDNDLLFKCTNPCVLIPGRTEATSNLEQELQESVEVSEAKKILDHVRNNKIEGAEGVRDIEKSLGLLVGDTSAMADRLREVSNYLLTVEKARAGVIETDLNNPINSLIEQNPGLLGKDLELAGVTLFDGRIDAASAKIVRTAEGYSLDYYTADGQRIKGASISDLNIGDLEAISFRDQSLRQSVSQITSDVDLKQELAKVEQELEARQESVVGVEHVSPITEQPSLVSELDTSRPIGPSGIALELESKIPSGSKQIGAVKKMHSTGLEALAVRGDVVKRDGKFYTNDGIEIDLDNPFSIPGPVFEAIRIETTEPGELDSLIGEVTSTNGFERLAAPLGINSDTAVEKTQDSVQERLKEYVEKDLISDSHHEVISKSLDKLVGDMEAAGMHETDPKAFFDTVAYVLDVYTTQQGGVLVNPDGSLRGYGSGGNRLRGGNGADHTIINANKIDSFVDKYNAALDAAVGRGDLTRLEADAKMVTPRMRATMRIANAMHDTMAANEINANTGLKYIVEGGDLKVGHQKAATRYLDHVREIFAPIFSDADIGLMKSLMAGHDNSDVLIGGDTVSSLLMFQGFSDNTASEEKFIEAFTKVPGNEAILARLRDLKMIAGGSISLEQMKGLEDMVVSNIEKAREAGVISEKEAIAFIFSTSLDFNDVSDKFNFGRAYASGPITVLDADPVSGVVSVEIERSPLYDSLNEFVPDFAELNLVAMVEPYILKPGAEITVVDGGIRKTIKLESDKVIITDSNGDVIQEIVRDTNTGSKDFIKSQFKHHIEKRAQSGKFKLDKIVSPGNNGQGRLEVKISDAKVTTDKTAATEASSEAKGLVEQMRANEGIKETVKSNNDVKQQIDGYSVEGKSANAIQADIDAFGSVLANDPVLYTSLDTKLEDTRAAADNPSEVARLLGVLSAEIQANNEAKVREYFNLDQQTFDEISAANGGNLVGAFVGTATMATREATIVDSGQDVVEAARSVVDSDLSILEAGNRITDNSLNFELVLGGRLVTQKQTCGSGCISKGEYNIIVDADGVPKYVAAFEVDGETYVYVADSDARITKLLTNHKSRVKAEVSPSSTLDQQTADKVITQLSDPNIQAKMKNIGLDVLDGGAKVKVGGKEFDVDVNSAFEVPGRVIIPLETDGGVATSLYMKPNGEIFLDIRAEGDLGRPSLEQIASLPTEVVDAKVNELKEILGKHDSKAEYELLLKAFADNPNAYHAAMNEIIQERVANSDATKERLIDGLVDKLIEKGATTNREGLRGYIRESAEKILPIIKGLPESRSIGQVVDGKPDWSVLEATLQAGEHLPVLKREAGQYSAKDGLWASTERVFTFIGSASTMEYGEFMFVQDSETARQEENYYLPRDKKFGFESGYGQDVLTLDEKLSEALSTDNAEEYTAATFVYNLVTKKLGEGQTLAQITASELDAHDVAEATAQLKALDMEGKVEGHPKESKLEHQTLVTSAKYKSEVLSMIENCNTCDGMKVLFVDDISGDGEAKWTVAKDKGGFGPRAQAYNYLAGLVDAESSSVEIVNGIEIKTVKFTDSKPTVNAKPKQLKVVSKYDASGMTKAQKGQLNKDINQVYSDRGIKGGPWRGQAQALINSVLDGANFDAVKFKKILVDNGVTDAKVITNEINTLLSNVPDVSQGKLLYQLEQMGPEYLAAFEQSIRDGSITSTQEIVSSLLAVAQVNVEQNVGLDSRFTDPFRSMTLSEFESMVKTLGLEAADQTIREKYTGYQNELSRLGLIEGEGSSDVFIDSIVADVAEELLLC